MNYKFLSVCCPLFVIVILQCFGVDGNAEEKSQISWSLFGGDKNKIVRLEANPGFDSVLLTWLKYHEISMPGQQSKDFSEMNSEEMFKMTICENQAWGLHQCNSKLISAIFKMIENKRSSLSITKQLLSTDDPIYYYAYSLSVPDLRMSTTYSITIENEGIGNGKNVTFQTKGFSARSIVCEPSRTQVEIETGPNFGGQISVDGDSFPTTTGSNDGFCYVNGNASSRQTSYIFEIDHEKCDGVKISDSQMSASLTVQESLVIMTHSTRRFSITCDFGPTTFTVAAGLNVPFHMRPGFATGVGSVTEDLDLAIEEEEKRSLKDVSTARRKRRLRFQNESSPESNESVFSTVIVRKRKKTNKNNGTSTSMGTSGEDDGTALLVTANGLVPMPKIDLEFGSRRSDQVEQNNFSSEEERVFSPRIGDLEEEDRKAGDDDLPWKFPTAGNNRMGKTEIRFPKSNQVANWGKDSNLAVEWSEENPSISNSNSIRINRQTSTTEDEKLKKSKVIFRDFKDDDDVMHPSTFGNTALPLVPGEPIRQSKNLKIEDGLLVMKRGEVGKRHTDYALGNDKSYEADGDNLDERKREDETKKASALASDGSKSPETPAVPYLVLMIVLVISAIVATGASTYWLITTCQKKIAIRNRDFPNGKPCILARPPAMTPDKSDDFQIYENIETRSVSRTSSNSSNRTDKGSIPKCLSNGNEQNTSSFL